MKDEKDLNSTKMDQRGKNLDRQKKIPPGAWMSVSCECCVLSGRGLCDELVNSSRGVLPTVVCLKRV
jgi:hypothetical protein